MELRILSSVDNEVLATHDVMRDLVPLGDLVRKTSVRKVDWHSGQPIVTLSHFALITILNDCEKNFFFP